MVIYVGEIPIYYVSEFSADIGIKKTTEYQFLGNDTVPIIAEFKSNTRDVSLVGTLLQDSGVVKDIDDLAEDIMAIKDRPKEFNYLHSFQKRTGWLSIQDASSKKDADSLVTRPYSISGSFLPKSLYQPRFHSNPQIRTNDFAFTLGVDDCDNYIAIPIGATYSGGDGSTITRTSEDGTITLVKATVDGNVKWDVNEADRLNGECRIYDEDGVAEASWIRVFIREREFQGDVVAENGLYRIILDPSNEYITIYRWSGSAYTKIDDFTAGTYTRTTILENTPDCIRVKLDSDVEIELRRGHPPLIDTQTTDLVCVSLTPSDQTTTTENYLVLGTSIYICSDESFSLVNSTKNCDDGKKWIFYETVSATAEDIAHQAMVESRMSRELIIR